MYDELAKYLDNAFVLDFPNEIAGIAFNLYEDGENEWSLEVVGTSSFDEDDSDWACDEITTFDTRETPFSWKKVADWDEILSEMVELLNRYLSEGEYAKKLIAMQGLGVGFVDGDMIILHA